AQKNFLAQPADNPQYFQNFPIQSAAPSQSVPPLCASAPPVKGVLRLSPKSRKRFFQLFPKNHKKLTKPNNNNTLHKTTQPTHRPNPAQNTQKPTYPQNNTQTHQGLTPKTEQSPKTPQATAETNIGIASVLRTYCGGGTKYPRGPANGRCSRAQRGEEKGLPRSVVSEGSPWRQIGSGWGSRSAAGPVYGC
ncbi:hypothetical protein J7413_10545, partial [Shimia sp. R10_1]|uniref:hypothetical protein n=1 Tax=Shimia sp. R10_1 TaxID=2821095 RepID=UPI001ADC579E